MKNIKCPNFNAASHQKNTRKIFLSWLVFCVKILELSYI